MKKRTLTQCLSLLLIVLTCLLSSCNVEQLRGEPGEKGNGIESITTERVDGGTKVIIKYTDTSMSSVEFFIPDGQKGDAGEKGESGTAGRGILKTEIIDGCLWLTYTDDPENPVNVGRVAASDTTGDGPKVDMEGYTYRAYVRSKYDKDCPLSSGNPSFYCEDFWTSTPDADALSYAVYHRNQKIEIDYNVKILQVPQDNNMYYALLGFRNSGIPFDLTVILAQSAAVAVTNGLLMDLSKLEYIDLTHESYDQNSIRELTMCNKLYYLSGDMNISTMDNVSPTVVNMPFYRQLSDIFAAALEDNSCKDIYSLVSEKRWTMDTLLKMASIATVDADTSDGALDVNKGDSIGYFQYAYSTLYYFYGAGGRISEIGEDSSPDLVIQKEQNKAIFNYVYQNFNQHVSSLNMPNGFSAARATAFMSGDTLFTEMTLWDVRHSLYKNAGFEYGILPTPLMNEGDDYHSLVTFSNCAHLWAIPVVHQSYENAQIIMQAMAEASNVNQPGSTMDTYYTQTLSFAAESRAGSRQTLDIIRNSIVYDIATLYHWGGWTTILEEIDTGYGNAYPYKIVNINDAYEEMYATIDAFLKNSSSGSKG